ncbi:hypothetical protein [Paenibacillus sp. GCM10028914]|uniref:hypothetical protein n=1 Tax=Paenibacillus sp. GCM10028914 TaxID=3273416 RepID=UPI00360CCFFA
MRTDKKMFVIVGLIALSLGVIGCGESANENTEVERAEKAVKNEAAETDITIETKTETDTKKPSDEKAVTVDPLITKTGGLGDTKEAIEQLRGADENEEDAGISSYQNNTLLVIYAEDDLTKRTQPTT